MQASTIEWTDATWNPVTGCTKVSPGCKNCYAEAIAKRFWKGRKFTDVRCHPERLGQPLKWRNPRRVFVNSMSDLFHEEVPSYFVDDVVSVMKRAEQHVFQILTKRPSRMIEYFDSTNARTDGWPLPNVWLGVSIEDQEHANERIPLLFRTPAAVRFVSCEPLLGPINLEGICSTPTCFNALRPGYYVPEKLDWVIVGGESGPDARPCNVAWIRQIVEQCGVAEVPVFVKQLGSRPVAPFVTDPFDDDDGGVSVMSGCLPVKLRASMGADPAEWPEDLRVREFPETCGAGTIG